MTVATLIKSATRSISNNSPVILTALAVAGVASTSVLAVKATFEASTRLAGWGEDPITKREAVQVVWKLYIPAGLVSVGTIACVIGAHSINTRRNAALASLYTLSETAFREYQEANREVIGNTKEQSVRDRAASNRVNKADEESRQIVITGTDVLCHDEFSGQFFQSNMESLRKAQNDINEGIINNMYASLNEFYAKIGLPHNGAGDEVGFTTGTMLELVFSSVLTPENKPCLSFSFRVPPIGNYNKIW